MIRCLRRAWALAVAVAATPACAAGPAPACPGLAAPRPRVEVVVAPEPAPRVVPVPRSDIRRHLTGPARVTTGLTRSQVAGRASFSLVRASSPGGAACTALEAVRADLANRDVEILVDATYREGSCERRAVLAHEQEHVRINAAALRAGERSLRRRLHALARSWGGRWLVEEDRRAIDAAVGRALDEAVAAVKADAAGHHARLDSPASYTRTQRRCDDW